jgi:hypothetical protein
MAHYGINRTMMKRCLAMQTTRSFSSTGTAATSPFKAAAANLNVNVNVNMNMKSMTGRIRSDLISSSEADDVGHHHQTDYYQGGISSFESALNQVLRLELDSPTVTHTSYHHSLETCVRDFFRV